MAQDMSGPQAARHRVSSLMHWASAQPVRSEPISRWPLPEISHR